MPPTIEQLQARHQTLAREAVRARQALADLRRQVRRHERMIAALGGVEPPDDMTLSIAECRALVDYLDACLIAEVSLGEIVVEEPRVPPQAFSYVGPVDSVGFDHTRKSPWVGLHIGARTRRCEATNEHLATAQAHSENVQAAVLYLPKGPSGQPAWRLLWIRSGHAVIAKPDKNDHSQIFKRWGAVLERLGK